MENNQPDPVALALDKWKGLALTKKVFVIIVGLVGVFFVLFILASLNSARSTSLGLSTDSISYPPMYNGVPMGTPPTPTVTRDIAYYEDEYVPGNDAEAFETKDYTARFETGDLAGACTTIDALKPQPNVIFLSASRGDTSCNYQFKVANEEVSAVLAALRALDPKELSERTASIKKQLENSLNQRTILTENLAATEAILAEALAAYDNLLLTATNAQDSAALAQAVRDKINLIDQLKQRRESTRQQIDSLNRQLAEQQDRLEYTYFSVSVIERVYFDSETIKASWHRAVREMITNANGVLQKLSTGLVSFILYVVLYTIYLVIILVIAKYGWRIVQAVWRK